VVPLDKSINYLLVDLHGAREADGFASEALGARSERQIVMFDMLREVFTGQMYLTGDLPSVFPPVIAGDKANLERRNQTQQATACFIVARAESVGNYSFSLGIRGISKPMVMVFVANIGPLLIKFTDKRHIIEHHLFGGY
jgi:hypothetical protein